MGKSMPSQAAPTPPPEVPTEETLTEEEERARKNEERRQKQKEGVQQTILTTGLGTTEQTKTKPSGILGG